jgi:hypothetical protein
MPITVNRCGPHAARVSFHRRALPAEKSSKVFFSREIARDRHQSIILLMLMELQPITSKWAYSQEREATVCDQMTTCCIE